MCVLDVRTDKVAFEWSLPSADPEAAEWNVHKPNEFFVLFLPTLKFITCRFRKKMEWFYATMLWEQQWHLERKLENHYGIYPPTVKPLLRFALAQEYQALSQLAQWTKQ